MNQIEQSTRPKARVLHVITRFVKGGADENTFHTIKGLEAGNFAVDLATGEESDFSLLEELNLDYVVVKGLKRNISPLNDIKAFWRLYKMMRIREYQIVHTHTAKAGFLGRTAAKLAKTPVIIHTLHGITFHDFLNPLLKQFYLWVEKVAGLFTDRFVTVGDDIKETYIEKRISKPENYVTIRSGMSLHRFIEAGHYSAPTKQNVKADFGITNGEILIGTACRLEPRKGLDYLLRAAKELTRKYSNIRFLIAGDGFKKDELLLEVEKLNLADSVRFLGFRDDIHNFLSVLDIFTLTSLWEGLPRVLVQAAAVGKPIVTFDIEGATEIVKNGVNGFVVPVKNVSELVDKISYLIENPEQANYMGESGKDIVGDAWDAEIMKAKISKLYDEITYSQ
ncbi:MAG: glycosyltransferase family 4 protein [bacterium]